MKTFLKTFWKHMLCIILAFLGAWIFNHISAWFGIFVALASLAMLVNYSWITFSEWIENTKQN